MTKFLKEPLIQFVLGGAILYGLLFLFAPVQDGDDDPLSIRVDDERLLTYLQYQDKAFDGDQARQVLGALDADARQKLVDEYVRDEIMVREALALGLDQNDDVISQRLIQKMDFIFQGFAAPNEVITDDELSSYFSTNKKAYAEEAKATFTHVFYKNSEQPGAEIQAQASAVLKELIANEVPFEGAGQYGDRFYFFKNYINRPELMVKSHFGEEAAEAIFERDALSSWFGPIRSTYGWHLFFVRSVQPPRIPDLAEVAGQVRADLLRERRDAVRREAFEKVAQKYTVAPAAEK